MNYGRFLNSTNFVRREIQNMAKNLEWFKGIYFSTKATSKAVAFIYKSDQISKSDPLQSDQLFSVAFT